jgi:hypothetical protein
VFLQHGVARGTWHVRNYGCLAPGNRVEALKLLAELFDLNAKEEEEEPEKGASRPKRKRSRPNASVRSAKRV